MADEAGWADWLADKAVRLSKRPSKPQIQTPKTFMNEYCKMILLHLSGY
jgi:hypothetical protein